MQISPHALSTFMLGCVLFDPRSIFGYNVKYIMIIILIYIRIIHQDFGYVNSDWHFLGSYRVRENKVTKAEIMRKALSQRSVIRKMTVIT